MNCWASLRYDPANTLSPLHSSTSLSPTRRKRRNATPARATQRQRDANDARARKKKRGPEPEGVPSGLPVDLQGKKKGKAGVKGALERAQVATASLGQFDAVVVRPEQAVVAGVPVEQEAVMNAQL